MQKLTLTSLLAFFALALFGQKIDDIKESIGKQDWTKAKDQIDKYMANEKSMKKNEGIWYYKAVVFNELAKDENLSATLLNGVDGRKEAFEAYKKHLEVDEKNILGTLEQNVRLFDIYNGYFGKAVSGFNSRKYDIALENFQKAWEVEKFIQSKGFAYNTGSSEFSFPAFDTSMVQNLASSAYNAKKEEVAVDYYKLIADQKIAGDDFLNIYQYLIEYYNKKGDKATATRYLTLGKELYPGNYYWIQSEIDAMENEDISKRLAKYDELVSKNPGVYLLLYNYAVELFNYAYTSDEKPANYKEVQKKIEETLNKAVEANKQDPHEANILMSRHLYNVTFDLQEEQRAIKGQTPADQKKRNDLRDQINAKFEVILPHALSSYTYFEGKKDELRASEKGTWKLIAEIISACYDSKKMPDKADEYRQKMKTIL